MHLMLCHRDTAHMAARLVRLPVSWRCDEPFARIGTNNNHISTVDLISAACALTDVQSPVVFVKH